MINSLLLIPCWRKNTPETDPKVANNTEFCTFLTKLLWGHMKYNFWAPQTQRRPHAIRAQQPHGVRCEPYPPVPLQILWDPSTVHIQGQCQPSATQTGGRWRCAQAWCWGRTEPSRSRERRATARTSSCSEVVRVLSSHYLYPCRKHGLQSKCSHEQIREAQNVYS